MNHQWLEWEENGATVGTNGGLLTGGETLAAKRSPSSYLEPIRKASRIWLENMSELLAT